MHDLLDALSLDCGWICPQPWISRGGARKISRTLNSAENTPKAWRLRSEGRSKSCPAPGCAPGYGPHPTDSEDDYFPKDYGKANARSGGYFTRWKRLKETTAQNCGGKTTQNCGGKTTQSCGGKMTQSCGGKMTQSCGGKTTQSCGGKNGAVFRAQSRGGNQEVSPASSSSCRRTAHAHTHAHGSVFALTATPGGTSPAGERLLLPVID